MEVNLKSDFEISEEQCKASTGKLLSEWINLVEPKAAAGRRETISWLYDETGRGKDTWWPTTIWVEFERSRGIVNKKDGRAEGYNICVTKTVKASADAVYKAWTESSEEWLDCNHAAENSDYQDRGGNTGTWLRLRPAKDVRIQWKTKGVDTPTTVDATFVEKDGKTGITVQHARIQTREEADGLRNAWTEALNKLKQKLEA
jgi:uncharacterized protein YndB with AHSA1/START domain